MSYLGEPIGAEAAIFWHLQEIDRLQFEAAVAEANDHGDIANQFDAQGLQHQVRLVELEDEFPETAKKCRDDLRINYQQRLTYRDDLRINYQQRLTCFMITRDGRKIAAEMIAALRTYRELLGDET